MDHRTPTIRPEPLEGWVRNTEGARLWLSILTDLKNRGVQDVFFVCCDDLTGFSQAIEAAFPQATVRTCIVHMIRASLRYASRATARTSSPTCERMPA
jgi:putative transposase